MLTFDFFTNFNLQNQESLGNLKKIEKSADVSADKNAIDWLLQTMLFQSTLKSTSTAIKPNPLIRNSSSKESKNEKILKEISQFSRFYRRMRQIGDSKVTQRNMQFIEQIGAKLRKSAYCHTAQREAQEAQKFLDLQMDKWVLHLYQEHSKQLKGIMDKTYQFYTKQENFGKRLALNDEDLRIVEILLEYGAQIESKDLEYLFHRYLSIIPTNLKDSARNGEIEAKCLKEIAKNINTYRSNKMKFVGLNFFANLADHLPPQERERIADSIAKVLSFYSQSNAMEVKGYKISWQLKQPNLQDYHSFDSLHSVIKNAQNAEIKIEFQVLIIFPTRFQNMLES